MFKRNRTQLSRDRRRVLYLVLVLFFAATVTTTITITLLYTAAVEAQRSRLMDTVQSQARFVKSVARFDAEYSHNYPEGALAATLQQIRDAHSSYQGEAASGEFVLAAKKEDTIILLLNRDRLNPTIPVPRTIPWDSPLAEPMRQALSGDSGTMLHVDYRGTTVMAAFTPLPELGMEIVAKIDLWEVRQSFVRAALISGLAGLLIIAGCTLLITRITEPMIKRMRLNRATLEEQVRQQTSELSSLNSNLHKEIARKDKNEKRLQEAEKIAQLGHWEYDIVNNTLDWSDEIYRIFELDQNTFTPSYQGFIDVIHPDDRAMVKEAYTASLEKKRSYTITHRLLMMDGSVKFVNEQCQTRYDSNGIPLSSLGTVQNITESVNSRMSLEASQQYLDDLFLYAPVGYVVMEWAGIIRDVNETALDYFQLKRSEVVGQVLQAFIAPKSLTEYEKSLTVLLKNRQSQHLDVYFLMPDKHRLWTRIDQFLLTKIGEPEPLILCSIQDISREKEVEQQRIDLNRELSIKVDEQVLELEARNKELEQEVADRIKAEEQAHQAAARQTTLVREIHHRVKNNMQIVVSLLKLQSKQIDNQDALFALQESQNRVRALAMIHEILYQSDDLAMIAIDQYLDRLSRHLSIAYNSQGRRIRIRVKTLLTSLHIDQAVPIGLITTEIISNSLKYGFPDGQPGEITINMFVCENGECALIIADNGIGLPLDIDLKNCDSLGLRLMYRLAEDQLGGRVEIKREKGTEISVFFKKK